MKKERFGGRVPELNDETAEEVGTGVDVCM